MCGLCTDAFHFCLIGTDATHKLQYTKRIYIVSDKYSCPVIELEKVAPTRIDLVKLIEVAIEPDIKAF